MAKDRRGKKPSSRQVNLAEKAGAKPSAAKTDGKTRKKGKKRIGKIVAIVVLCLIVVAALVFLIVVGKYVWDTLNDDESDVPEVDLTLFDSTPEAVQDKVAYYLVGVMGADSESKTELLSLVCWDKVENTLDILQVPQDAYLGETGQWDVRYLGNVWNNPKPLDWCETCRRRVQEDEIADSKHTVCGTAITQKAGSAAEQLIDVFNDQYGVPVDDFFLIPQEGFVKLDRRRGAVIAVDFDKMRAMEELMSDMKVILAKAACKNISRKEIHDLVDTVMDQFGCPEKEQDWED